jgi:hypothetical protein
LIRSRLYPFERNVPRVILNSGFSSMHSAISESRSPIWLRSFRLAEPTMTTRSSMIINLLWSQCAFEIRVTNVSANQRVLTHGCMSALKYTTPILLARYHPTPRRTASSGIAVSAVRLFTSSHQFKVECSPWLSSNLPLSELKNSSGGKISERSGW